MAARLATFILTISLCNLSYSQTEYSKYIEGLQSKFGQVRPDQPIVYLDLDKIKMELAELGTNISEQKQSQIIVDFVERVSSLTISLVDAETLFLRMTTGSVSATPLKSVDKKEVCVVIPSNPNLNQKQATHRLLQWESLQETEEYKHKKINQY